MKDKKTFIWYDVNKDELIEWEMNLFMAVTSHMKGESPKIIKRVETKRDFSSGRLVGIDDSICEFIGEL